MKLPLLVSALVLVAGGAVAWCLGVLPCTSGKAEHAEAIAPVEEHGDDGGHGGEEERSFRPILALETFIANLADEGGSRYLQAIFQVEFLGAAMPGYVNGWLPPIRDLLLTLLSSKTFDDVRTGEGKQQLRQEVIARVNQVLDRDAVKARLLYRVDRPMRDEILSKDEVDALVDALLQGVKNGVVALDGEQLRAALAALADRDRIYVDTGGLGGDAMEANVVERLRTGAGEPLARAAVVSAGASDDALRPAWRQLAVLAPASCVVTKVDEGAGLGTACTWLHETRLPLAWLGVGQRVREGPRGTDRPPLVRWLVAACA